MWIANNWKDYEVIDTSSGEKLERWGDYILVRPDPQVIWNTPKKQNGWKKKMDIIIEVQKVAVNGNSSTCLKNGVFNTESSHSI